MKKLILFALATPLLLSACASQPEPIKPDEPEPVTPTPTDDDQIPERYHVCSTLSVPISVK